MSSDTEKPRVEPALQQPSANVAGSVPPAANRPGSPKKKSWLRWVWRFILLLIVLLIALLAGLWIWSGRDGSLAQAVNLAQRFVPIVGQSLHVTDIQGSIRHGGRVGSLRWQQPQVDVQLTNLDFAWDASALLLNRRLPVDHIVIDTLQIKVQPKPDEATPSQAALPPSYLGIPLKIDLTRWQVNTFIWGEENLGLIATQTAGNYRFDGNIHHLNVESINFARGDQQAQATLTATLTARKPQLDAKVQGMLSTTVPGSPQQAQINATVGINGLLTELHVQAQVDAETLALAAATPPTEEGGVESVQAAQSAAPLNATTQADTTPSVDAMPQQASLQATITPWAPLIVPQADLTLKALNMHAFWPQAPATSLTGNAQVTTQRNDVNALVWLLATHIQNEIPGALDQQLLPVSSLNVKANWQNNTATVEQVEVLAGGGVVSAQGHFQLSAALEGSTARPTWQAQISVKDVDPKIFYSTLANDRISGSLTAEQQPDVLTYDIALKSSTPPADHILSLRLQHALARGSWSNQTLNLDALSLKTTYSSLEGQGSFVLPEHVFDEGTDLQAAMQNAVANGKFDLTAPGIQAHAQITNLTAKAGTVQADLKMSDAQETLTWIQTIPVLPKSIHQYAASGALDFELQAQGGWLDPQLTASLKSPELVLLQKDAEDPKQVTALIDTANTQLNLNGRLSLAELKVQSTALVNKQVIGVEMQAQGGLRNDSINIQIAQLQATLYKVVESASVASATTPWVSVQLEQPVDVSWQSQNQRLQIAPGSLSMRVANTADAAPSLVWDTTTWQAGELNSTGKLSAFPVLWLLTFSQTQLAGLDVKGDLMLEGQWHIRMGSQLDFAVEIARSSGDLSLESEVSAFSSASHDRLQAGVREAQLKIYNSGSDLHAELVWDSENASIINVIAKTSLTRQDGSWTVLPSAPLSGQVIAQLPQLGVGSALAPTGWRFSGAAILDADLVGTIAQPGFKGRLSALGVSLRSVLDGIEFVDGNVQMVFDGTRVQMDTFSLRGAGPDGGEITAQGEIDLNREAPAASLNVSINKLKASVRSDRQLTTSGQINMALQGRELNITGKLSVDQALIIIGDFGAPALDDDVVVLTGNEQPDTASHKTSSTNALPRIAPHINLALNLGDDFRVQGFGLQTYLEGELLLQNQGYTPRLMGEISTKNGRFKAYAQNLHIETGIIRFTGPYDNPTLNILAIRPNLPEKVGVQVTGTAVLPKIRIYSASGLSDSEALSWLVLGRSSSADGAETAALQQAAMALLSGSGPGLTDKLAGTLGLDEISLGGASNSTASSGGDSLAETTITVGKRFSNNFYVAYEQGLSGAMGTFYVFYDISRRLTLRGEVGQYNALDLIYTFNFDGMSKPQPKP